MTDAPKMTRLAFYLEACPDYSEETEKLIWDRVQRAGAGPDDPLSIQIAHDTIMDARMRTYLWKAARLPGQIATAMKDSVSSIEVSQAQMQVDYAKRIANQISSETRDCLAKSMPMLETQLAKGARSRLRHGQMWRAFGILLAVVFIGYAGYVMGRVETSDLASEFAELARRPDARVWQNLQRLNMEMDLFIAEFCVPGQPNYFHHSDGRAACDFSLFLEGTSAPAPVGYIERAGDFLASAWAKTSYEALAFLGLFGAALGIYGLARIKAWMASRSAGASWNT